MGVHTTELESLLRVEYVQRLATTLVGNVRTGQGPSHEQVGLAAGLNRGEVQNIRAKGHKSASLRMKKKAQQHSKSARVLDLWKSNSRYLSTSGTPLALPVDIQAAGPSFEELVAEALPGKRHKNVLKDLHRRGLVQLLPDEIVRYRRAPRPLPIELNATSLSYIAEQMRIVGTTLLQNMTTPNPGHEGFGAYVASEPLTIPTDLLAAAQAALKELSASLIGGIDAEFGAKRKANKKAAAKTKRISIGIYWRTE
jgi:hypothetical protein